MLVAGKGHEKYQVVGDRVLPFDDVEVARAALLSAAEATRGGGMTGAARMARPAARTWAQDGVQAGVAGR